MSEAYDIIIVGSGIVGAATALALARSTSLKIAVLEAKVSDDHQEKARYDHRVSAISLASKTILQNLHCWESIKAKRVSAYTQMHVWDAAGVGEIHFDSQSIGESLLGYIIEDRVIRRSLQDQFQCYQNIDFLCPAIVDILKEKENQIELVLSDQKTLQTKLLIGADGANSWVRTNANIEFKNYDYAHTAIVATVRTTLPNQATAWQRFLPTGPLAFLPFDDPHDCSIVWSAEHEYAKNLLSLDDEAFCEKLSDEFSKKLGVITSVSQRYSFPLRMRHVKNYVSPHLALIGDAAHTLHPLAGQGVNLGLLDAATLAEVIIDAHKKNRDFSSLSTLRRYERWRKSDTLVMLTLVEALKQLFGSHKKSVQQLRNFGLNLTNQLPFIKNFLISYALGKRGDLPGLGNL